METPDASARLLAGSGAVGTVAHVRPYLTAWAIMWVRSWLCPSNQGTLEKEGVKPGYIIYNFPELLNAIRFFEAR